MDLQDKIDAFAKELEYIRNADIRKFAELSLGLVPDYFFVIPASSTGKFHPSYALGDGGLLRHVRAAVSIAVELFRTDLWEFTEDQKDLILVALILHDGRKSGSPQQKFTVTEHPILMAEAIMDDPNSATISPEYRKLVADAIFTHMGKWTQDFKSKQEVLQKPKSTVQRFVHMVDYIASRKCLEFNFETQIDRE